MAGTGCPGRSLGGRALGLGDTGRTVVPDGAHNIFTKVLSDFPHTVQHRVANLSLQEVDSKCFRLHGPKDRTRFLSQPLGSAAGG